MPRPPRTTAILVGLIAWSLARTESAPSLYDWMATAPVVVIGTIVVDDQRYIEIEPSTMLRGTTGPGTRLAVDVRSANRDRPPGVARVKPVSGQSFLMLLAPPTLDSKKRKAVHHLVHGVGGAREIPEEGRQVFVAALTRMAAVQALKSDTLAWQEFRRMLEDTNPLLVETALQMYEKFRRAGPQELPILRPLLDHPRPALRAAAARVIGIVAARPGTIPQEQSAQIVGELVARARRDDDILVRVAATGALAGFSSRTVDELLHTIAEDDPDQAVRLEAQKTLYERGTIDPPPARVN